MTDLYVARKKIHPKAINGFFQTIRRISLFIALSWFFVAPWISFHGQQAILFDIEHRQFRLFAYTFWPQDFFLLALLMIIGALGLFFFTVLAGRIWCGYACPQTVWTKLFIWVEALIEGGQNKRIKLDKQGFGFEKFIKRVLKHSVWLAIAFLTAMTFVGYFIPVEKLIQSIVSFSLGQWPWFWLVFFTLATYINAGWMREQVCLYMCPYARFQSVMFDSDTLIISYDESRGEPRGSRPKTAFPGSLGLGDCIDCKQCVQVCPTGIDIRQGLQMECIGCAACIDACDEIMDKMDYPRNLIRYSTENKIERKPSNIFRVRLISYACVFIIMSSSFLYFISTRSLVGLDIIRDRKVLYRDAGSSIENVYVLKIRNMSQQSQHYVISVESDFNAQLLGVDDVHVDSGEIYSHPVRVNILKDDIASKVFDVTFNIVSDQGRRHKASTITKFLSP